MCIVARYVEDAGQDFTSRSLFVFDAIMDIMNGRKGYTIRIYSSGRYYSFRDYSDEILSGVSKLFKAVNNRELDVNNDVVTGNDAPRGGRHGNFIKIREQYKSQH